MITCSFCGNIFEEKTVNKACEGCPMSNNCNKIKCPKCNFENVKPIGFKWNLFAKRNKSPYLNNLVHDTICNITEMKAGQKAKIKRVEVSNNNDINKLIVFGITEGEILELIQKFPSYVIKVGNTKVALDKDMASSIQVDYNN